MCEINVGNEECKHENAVKDDFDRIRRPRGIFKRKKPKPAKKWRAKEMVEVPRGECFWHMNETAWKVKLCNRGRNLVFFIWYPVFVFQGEKLCFLWFRQKNSRSWWRYPLPKKKANNRCENYDDGVLEWPKEGWTKTLTFLKKNCVWIFLLIQKFLWPLVSNTSTFNRNMHSKQYRMWISTHIKTHRFSKKTLNQKIQPA